MIEILKSIILGIVEGITEWLPISSTGHMILVDEFLKMKMSPEFMNMFFVVIQLGAILAVVLLYWKRLFPFTFDKKPHVDKSIIMMWLKIAVSCVPAGIVGILWDEQIEAAFYNYFVVSMALIIFGILFIVVERKNINTQPKINSIDALTWKAAIMIGLFQLIAAIFPGTSRSGATIVGALLIGVSREVAAEFTFFLAIPVMFGASLLKLIKFGFVFTAAEFGLLLLGCVVSFVVSIVAIKFLMTYIKKNDFKVFGFYRIVLGAIIVVVTLFRMIFG